MKRIVLISLLLAGCAYQPNIDASQQARPTYQDDLAKCTHQMEDVQHRLYNGFGLVGILYGEYHYTADEVHESEQLSSFQGQHTYIDNCMKAKGYTVLQ